MPTLFILCVLFITPLFSHAAPFEVQYQQKPYRTSFPLQWRAVTDPAAGQLPNWDHLNQIQVGMNSQQVRALLGEPWFSRQTYRIEWNYLYRYTFSGNMQQCQYKLIFDSKHQQVQGIFWEPVAQAHCRH